MGWYFQHIRGRSRADKDRFLRSEIEQISDKPGKAAISVIKSAFVGSTWYAAVRISVPDQPPYTVAHVFPTQMCRDGEFGYKPMDERVGPCEASCPVGIMGLLTPIEQLPNRSYAGEWRTRVAAEHERAAGLRRLSARIVNGTRIRFQTPIRFTDGQSFDRFLATSMERRGRTILVFVPLCRDGHRIGGRYRISRRALAAAEIEDALSATTPPESKQSAA